MEISEIDTPALLVDLDSLESNIAKMSRFAREAGCSLRPHIKVHKTPAIAHKQIAAGAIGVTCAKLGEAEVMASSGIGEILIANQIVSPEKIQRLVGLSRHTSLMVAFDDPEVAERVAREAAKRQASLGAVIEVDTGMGRAGVRPGRPTLALARKIRSLDGLAFRGVMGYEGHLQHIERLGERTREVRKSLSRLTSTVELLRREGIESEVVSAGGTNSYSIAGTYDGVTEIQAGSYVFMDVEHELEGVDFRHALTVLSTVTSRPDRGRAIIDAGLKSFADSRTMPRATTEGIEVQFLSEEHGRLRTKDMKVGVGDRLEFYPYYAPTTVNLYDRLYGVRDGRVEVRWEISARGKSQ